MCDYIQHTRVRIGPNILTEISCICAIKFAHGAGYDPVWSLMNIVTNIWAQLKKDNFLTNGVTTVDRDSVVGIATCYGLDGPGNKSRLERDFRYPSRPALGSTQPPIQWVPGISRV